MGRLFWKFFLVFWLALLTAGGGVGTAVWLHNRALDEKLADDDFYQPRIDTKNAAPYINVAVANFYRDKATGLRSFLEDWLRLGVPPIFAVDGQGQEMLGRDLAPEILSQAKLALNVHPRQVRRVVAENGQTYLIFMLTDKNHKKRPLLAMLQRGHSARLPPKPPSLAVPIISGIFASVIFSGLLAWYFAMPIRHLRSAFAAVARGDLNARAAVKMGNRRDELADLGDNFDEMVKQIQMLMDAQRHLLHDVSHELRSPLARMQVAIGLAHQQPDKAQATLERIERESQRMSDLVGELLTLSRMEAGGFGKLESIDISGLLAEIVEDAQFEADVKNTVILTSVSEPLLIKGYPELLRRAFENVLRNAVQHSKTGSTVTIGATLDNFGDCLHVVVADQGDGVAEADLAAIFKPFFRCTGSLKNQSIGLGLTIAQKAVEAHKGKIIASNQPEGGLRVEFVLPGKKCLAS